jgi:hypothetical protein
MLRDAAAGRFDLLLIYDNDRLSSRRLVGAKTYDLLNQAEPRLLVRRMPGIPLPAGSRGSFGWE